MYDTSHKLTRFQKRNKLYRPSALQAEGLKKTLNGGNLPNVPKDKYYGTLRGFIIGQLRVQQKKEGE